MSAANVNDETLTEPEVIAAPKTRMQRLRWPLILVAPIAVLIAAYFYFSGGRYQSTDDAYTQAATTSISANVAGRVLEIFVHDNQLVKRDEPLYRIDDAPFKIAVSDAQARLGSARLQIASLKSTYRQSKWSCTRRATASTTRSVSSTAIPACSPPA
jgi:membrane fusion protein (multidrug efflux system)